MIGHCKHGEFDLEKGCPRCVAERMAVEGNTPESIKEAVEKAQPRIVKVQYFSEKTGELSPREYTYYSIDRLNVGDIVIVPVRDTTGKAKVSTVDVQETEIAAFKDKVKTIPAGSVVTEKPESSPIPSCQPDNLSDESVTRADIFIEEYDKLAEDSTFLNEPVTTAVTPAEDEKVIALYNEGLALLKAARTRTIATNDDLKPATDDLSLIAKLKKAIEEKRKDYTVPLRNELDKVNATFKEFTEPLNQADVITRGKVSDFRTEIARKRLEAERIEEDKLALAKREAELNGGAFTVDLEPVNKPEATPHRTFTDMGSIGTMKVPKWEVEDFAAVPNEYKVIDAGRVGKVIKAGGNIPGIRTWTEDVVRVNTR